MSYATITTPGCYSMTINRQNKCQHLYGVEWDEFGEWIKCPKKPFVKKFQCIHNRYSETDPVICCLGGTHRTDVYGKPGTCDPNFVIGNSKCDETLLNYCKK